MPDDLRVGLVGCGRLAEVGYVPALRRAAGVHLAAVADPDRARRETLAAGLPAYEDASAMLGAGPVDALVLATPCELHVDDARRAAADGVPALVEKPPAPDAAAARALMELRPTPWVGFNRRFEPAVAAVREAIEAHRGEQIALDLRLRYRRASWGAHTVGDDALLDLGPHVLDLARHLSGAEVSAVRAARLEATRSELELSMGEAGRATVSLATDRPHRELIVARAEGRSRGVWARRGSGGLARGAVAAAASRLGRAGEHPLVASLAAQLEAFARAVRGEPSGPLATAADGAAVMEAIDAARASARGGGGWIAVGSGGDPGGGSSHGGSRSVAESGLSGAHP